MSLRWRDAGARELLGRHVGGGAVADLGAGKLVGDGGESEVHDDEVAALVHHDVLRLEVAVDDAAVVSGGESGAELARGLDGACRRGGGRCGVSSEARSSPSTYSIEMNGVPSTSPMS